MLREQARVLYVCTDPWIVLNSGDVGHFKRTVRPADFCRFLGRGDKLLPLPTVVYPTSKLEVWHSRIGGVRG